MEAIIEEFDQMTFEDFQLESNPFELERPDEFSAFNTPPPGWDDPFDLVDPGIESIGFNAFGTLNEPAEESSSSDESPPLPDFAHELGFELDATEPSIDDSFLLPVVPDDYQPPPKKLELDDSAYTEFERGFHPEKFFLNCISAPARAIENLQKSLESDRVALFSYRDPAKRTPLLVAAREGHLPLVSLLLEAGVDKDAAMHNRINPIYAASEYGHLAVVARLLEAGADLNVQNTDDGATPVYIAAQNGHLEVVSLLIAAGANFHTPMKDGRTPLYAAAQNGHHRVVGGLIAADADPDALTETRFSPLFIATQNGHHEVAEVLLAAGVDVNAIRSDNTTYVYLATCRKHYRVVEILLACGADPNVEQLLTAHTALDRAILQESEDIVALLQAVPLPLQTLCTMKLRLEYIRNEFNFKLKTPNSNNQIEKTTIIKNDNDN